MKRQVVAERILTQRDFDRFAKLSGDANPIHTDASFSARTRFGRPVAHGLLLVSVLRGLVEQMAPGSRLRRHAVIFPAPTYAEEAMRFTVTADETEETPRRLALLVERAQDGTVTCQGEAWITHGSTGDAS